MQLRHVAAVHSGTLSPMFEILNFPESGEGEKKIIWEHLNLPSYAIETALALQEEW